MLLYRDLFEDKSALILWQFYMETFSNLTQEAIAQKIKNVFAVYNDIKVQSQSAEFQIKAMMSYFLSLINTKQ